MRFKVKIHPSAAIDADEFIAFIRDEKGEPIAAVRWFEGLSAAILALGSQPESHPIIQEQDAFKIEIRQTLYHSHRIIFHIDKSEGIVDILRIYHGARDSLHPEMVENP